ncbi:MAG: hypothetical protein U0984_16530 [Prosthecobacter sp.]|nr:hypothetical protein [Prosthecobacter sp.]
MNTKGVLIRLVVLAVIYWLCKLGFDKVRDDPAMMFIYVIVLGLIAGLLLVKYLLPVIGDAVSTAVFSSGEQVRPDESMKAAAKLAQGDYEGAIAEHEKALAENPKQAFVIGEIAKICNDKLGDPQRALTLLKQHLEGTEWTDDDAAFLRFRTIDIHIETLKDYDGALELLRQVIATFPNTRHSANAHHRMNEVEQIQFKQIMEQRLKAGGKTE